MLNLMNNKQVSLWVNDQYLNLYPHNTLPTESVLRMTKVSTMYFEGKATKQNIKEARMSLMMEALVDPDDSIVILGMDDLDVDATYTLWVLGNG
jgi:hypothetical protein